MKPEQLISLLTFYEGMFVGRQIGFNEYQEKDVKVNIHPVMRAPDMQDQLMHASWMTSKLKDMENEDPDKIQRWLGFIQGILWCNGIFTITDMKEHNRSMTP